MARVDYSDKRTLTRFWEKVKERGGSGGSVSWNDITGKPDNLATTEDVDAKVFIAEYNVTTAQQIIAHLDSAKEPFAPILIKRGNDYYTCTTAAKQADNKIIIRSFATLSGNFFMFTYTVTNGSWSSSSYGFQQLLESGTSIKTVGGQSLLGSGNIPISGGGDAVLSADLTASKTVGGIASGKKYDAGTALEVLFKDMLNPVENPIFTAPSAMLSASGGTLAEEGETAQKTLTVTFNRGKINPAYGTSGNRSGAATGYSLNGGASQSGNTFSVAVNEGNKTFSARVNYAAGEQPKNSAGENYDSPLPAGYVTTNTLTFEIVAALWSNAANIATVAKEPLISRSVKEKRFDFPAQTAANPEIFDVPATWTVTAVELLNTLNNQWVDDTSEFDVSDVTHGTVAYKRYTYNGGDATGARSIRIKWN